MIIYSGSIGYNCLLIISSLHSLRVKGIEMSFAHLVIPWTILVNNQYGINTAMQEKTKKFIVLLMMGVFVHHPVNSSIMKMLSKGFEVFEKMNFLHDTYSKFTTPSTADLLKESKEIAVSIERVEESLGAIQQSIDTVLETLLVRLPLLGKITSDVQLLNSCLGRIDRMYDELVYLLEDPDYFQGDAMNELLRVFTSYKDNDIAGTVGQMYTLIVPSKLRRFKQSLFVLLAQELQNDNLELCDTGASPQQRISDLFDTIVDAEMKASLMIAFGYMMQNYVLSANTTGNMKKAEKQQLKRVEGYRKTLAEALAMAPTKFRRCDPAEGHERGVTFHEFERFLQVFFVQEEGLTSRFLCLYKCPYYDQPTKLHVGCDGFECGGSSTTCFGQLFSCENTPGVTTVCEYNPLQSRRYSWYENSGVIYGHEKDSCPDGEFYYPEVLGSCDLCRCICVEDSQKSPSSHFISLREQITNVTDNMVVTGLALIMIDRIAHVKVMQSKLGPEATILQNGTSWVEPENIQFNQEKSTDADKAIFFKKSEDNDYEELVEDEDVAALSYGKRRIHLDSLSLPKDYVVTGVRFHRNMEEPSAPIQLAIQGTSFNYTTGQLDPESSTWYFPDNSEDREEYQREEYDNPIRSTETSIDTKPNSFIDIRWSSIEKDSGQTTIPLLDGLPIFAQPLVPLSGVGLYHKSQSGYGGFLTFVLEGFNQSPYL